MTYNTLEPAESLKEVFRSVQKTLKPVLNFDEKELKKVKQSAPPAKKKAAKQQEEKKKPVHDEDEAKRQEAEEWVEVDRYSAGYDRRYTGEKMDEIERLKLADLFESPALSVLQRSLFLFEIRVSVDY